MVFCRHLITLFGRARNSGENVSPICLAVFKLITNSDIIRTYAKKLRQFRDLRKHTLLSIKCSFRHLKCFDLGIRVACPIKEGESVILCFKPTKAVAWDYVLGVKRVIWPLSIFASAERLSSDEKSSVTNEGDEAAAVLDWVDIQLEARTQTVRRTRRDRADEYEKARTSEPLSAETLDPEGTCPE